MKAPKDHWDDDKRTTVPYLTKMVRIVDHKDWTGKVHDGPTEKQMVAQIGKLLSDKGWGPDNIIVQGGSVNKKKFN